MDIYHAIHIAIKSHENQFRKLDHDIYAAHPIEVGIILAKYGLDDAIIIAGILHDTVEDTTLTLDEIESTFGLQVRTYVEYCSEKNKDLPWETRKTNYLKSLVAAPLDVLFIVCADKQTNIKSIYRNMTTLGESIWDSFNAGYEKQKWYYNSILVVLAPISYHPLYTELKLYIEKVFMI